MSDQITLIRNTFVNNEYGIQEKETQETTVFCRITSVGAREFFNASQIGLKPAYEVEMYSFEYNNEQEAVIDGVTYSVYRTYLRSKDIIELYLEERVGVF